MPMKSSNHRGMRKGNRISPAGVPTDVSNTPLSARGVLVRGVVIGTYVPLDETAATTNGTQPSVVYCDVLTYSGMPGLRTVILKRCLVSQPHGGGPFEGYVWKPRAARTDLSTGELTEGSKPEDLDGDHVLVGFMDDSFTQPVILRSIPHPRTGLGNEDLAAAGHRQKLKPVDGEPSLFKQRGTFYGVDDKGNFLVDSSRAHDGEYPGGQEVPKGDENHGDIRMVAPATAEVTIRGLSVDGSNEAYTFRLKSNEILLNIEDDGTAVISIGGDTNLVLTGNDAAAALTLGNGTAHAAIVERLESLYADLKTQLDNHVHLNLGVDSVLTALATDVATAFGALGISPVPSSVALALYNGLTPPAAPEPPTTPAPEWGPYGINSTKVSFPDG